MASFIYGVKRKLAFLYRFVGTFESSKPAVAGENDLAAGARPQKRQRLQDTPATTPILRSFSSNLEQSTLPNSCIACELNHVPITLSSDECTSSPINKLLCTGQNDDDDGQPSDLLRMLPLHVIADCFSYITTKSDRFGLQVTCKSFRKLSNADDMLADIDLGGDWSKNSHLESDIDTDNGADNDDDDDDASAVTSRGMGNGEERDEVAAHRTGTASSIGGWVVSVVLFHFTSGSRVLYSKYVAHDVFATMLLLKQFPPHCGILLESDTSITACRKLVKFAAAGNMEAIYFLGMILCYCHENVNEGLSLLRHAARNGHLRSTYSLALVLRDSRHRESEYCLNVAATRGYAPAWQEKLSAIEMRARFGDLDATKLAQYFDPPCLNRLLGRHYLGCRRVRKHQTSHCWNPLCGRWAYKAMPPRLEEFRQRVMNRARGVGLISGHEAGISHEQGMQRRPDCQAPVFSIESLLPQSQLDITSKIVDLDSSPLGKIRRALCVPARSHTSSNGLKVSRMKMCSSCRRAKYCSKLCQVSLNRNSRQYYNKSVYENSIFHLTLFSDSTGL